MTELQQTLEAELRVLRRAVDQEVSFQVAQHQAKKLQQALQDELIAVQRAEQRALDQAAKRQQVLQAEKVELQRKLEAALETERHEKRFSRPGRPTGSVRDRLADRDPRETTTGGAIRARQPTAQAPILRASSFDELVSRYRWEPPLTDMVPKPKKGLSLREKTIVRKSMRAFIDELQKTPLEDTRRSSAIFVKK